jgi:uncharacterized membrane protein YhaH (DUF805 family)
VAQQRRFPFVTALLVTLTAAGLVLMAGAAGVAVYANSPANRQDNPFADIGVVAGVVIATFGTLVAFVCALALVVRAHQRR